MKITTINTIKTESKWNDQDPDPIGDILAMKKAIEDQIGYVTLCCPFCFYQFPNHWKHCIQYQQITVIMRGSYEDHNNKYNRNIKSL